MRTVLDLPDSQVEGLKRLGERNGLSRAELVRRAVAEYLSKHPTDDTDSAFGLWRNRAEDGLKYQQRIREEWDE
ncbi:MAG TPA: CopG family transcriptional regulator [Chromatiaceae bacterium]|jgi:metal-responsive CopG/Arc/MetJ family transcriptional regulator|nr:MAG: ribbon-helix-helix protein, CopG family [Thiohalocapsa sp. PB-PSB1]HBG93913.1 CopG family transcriptional regulator [Chromatiaceae bacterium]HCS91917.1 CopG family transcriptional regulator [Chromatiaceae bacterium]